MYMVSDIRSSHEIEWSSLMTAFNDMSITYEISLTTCRVKPLAYLLCFAVCVAVRVAVCVLVRDAVF